MYKRYQGNSGLVRRVEESVPPPPPPASGPFPGPGSAPPRPPGHRPPPPPGPVQGLLGRLGGLLPGLREGLETEDLLLLLILYLLYRESGDTEWLIALGAMLL